MGGMKTFGLIILFLIWCTFTLVLTVSILGLVVFLLEDTEGESVWMTMGRDIISGIFDD